MENRFQRWLATWCRPDPMAIIRRRLTRLAEFGTEGYPRAVQRRLKIMNVVAYLIAFFTMLYIVQYLFVDFRAWRPVILVNICLALTALTIPFHHRFGEIVGGLTIAVAELAGLFLITMYLGRSSGVQLQFVAFAAAPFVILGLERIRLTLLLVLGGFALHLASWFHFRDETAIVAALPGEINGIYLNAAITTFAIVAATVWYAFHLAHKAETETEDLLRNILPGSVVERLKAAPGSTIADSFDVAAVLFTDLQGFVPTAKRLGPAATVDLLNRLMHAFDRVAERHGIEKIKTIGDAYMAVAGVPEKCENASLVLAQTALDLLIEAENIAGKTGVPLAMRIGIATGPVMAGVIGAKRLTYDVWGDTVNLASRLEGLAQPGTVHLCKTTAAAIEGTLAPVPCGSTEVKGFGVEPTWMLRPPPPAQAPL
ncbi:MAG: adenylate/guanylate cyclase domain-containing protein [Pseudorhodoplanes sp.]